MKMEENHSHPGTRYETDEHARENDADSMLDDIDEPEEVMDEDTEADDEDDFEGSQTELILTEMSPAVIEEDDESQVSNSSSSRSKSDEKDDDDSRGQSKAVDSPAISPPMSRKRRIQDVAPVETDKSQVCNLPTDLEIREGKDYQALVPEYVERSEEERSSEVEKEVKHWVPVDQAGELNEDKIDAYCDLCEQEYKMNRHQSLYMLYLSSYNIEEAKAKCAQRAAYKEEWSAEDKHLFQQYLNIFGKNFGRINTAMPHKTPSALIEQYYNTKKTHSQKSFFDADHHAHKEGEDEYDESSDEEEEGESGETSRNSREQSVTDRNGEDKNDSNDIDPSVCSNCGQFVSIRKETPCGKLCTTCNLYFQKNGCMRPHQAVHHAATRKCPPEMTAVVSEFRRFAHVIVEGKKSEDSDPKEIYLGRKYVIDEDLQKIQRSMLEIRSSIARAERTMTDFDFRLKDREVDKYRKIAASVTKPCATSRVREQWTQREMTVAFHLLVLHGNNHSRIASCLRTKTAAHVREFAEKYSQELQEAIVKQEAEDCAEPPGSAAEGDTSDDGESENGCSEVGV